MQTTPRVGPTIATLLLTVASLYAGTHAALAEETYYAAGLNDLQWIDGSPPTAVGNWVGEWRNRAAMRTYARLDGAGEAYVEIQGDLWSASTNLDSRSRLAVRVPEPRDVTGTLYVARDALNGMDAIRFRVPAAAAASSARERFYIAKEATYTAFLSRSLPGAAWFRHLARQARSDRGGELEDAEPPRQAGLERPSELEDTFLLFTGGRAVSENLQLDRALPPQGQSDELVDLAAIQGITVAEIDWSPLLEDIAPQLDAMASHLPADQHAVFFPDFKSMVNVLDEATRTGTPVLDLLEPRAEDARTKERYETQLCLTVNALARLVGPQVIASVAITGSDPYLRLGSDVAILFEARQPEVLLTYLRTKHAAALQATPTAKALSGESSGVKYHAVVSPDRIISSYLAAVGNVVLVTNSSIQLERIIGATQEKLPTLAGLPEYKFFRDRYKLGEEGESAFLMLSDATIRRWCSPRWRIGDSRRTRAAAVLSELHAAHLNALAGNTVTPGPLSTTFSLPGDDALELTQNGVRSSTYGALRFLTPIAELHLDKVSEAESEAYRRWRDGYQRNWRRYFDPIAVRLTVHPDRLAADVTVMPLIAGTDYRDFIDVTRGAKIAADAGDPHPETLFHAILAINPKSAPIQRFGFFARSMAPGLPATNPLGWLGSSVALYTDTDPLWEEAFRAENAETFLEENPYRLPLALRVEIADSFGAAAFLTALRVFIEQAAPGMLVWDNVDFEGHTYVKVTAADDTASGLGDLAIYYGVTPHALTITLSESLLQRALRRAAGAQKEKDDVAATDANDERGSAHRKPWLGESLSLRATQAVARLVEVFSREEYQTVLRLRSWSSLPILNEWKRLYPDTDPLELHERLWGVRLVCPGGGTYVWNEQFDTMESTAFGHPAVPRKVTSLPWPLHGYTEADFGLTFEEQGLRARAILKRETEK